MNKTKLYLFLTELAVHNLRYRPNIFHLGLQFKKKAEKEATSWTEKPRCINTIVHFTVVCLVTKPLNRNEAKGDLVMIQTLLCFKCKLLCYHAN